MTRKRRTSDEILHITSHHTAPPPHRTSLQSSLDYSIQFYRICVRLRMVTYMKSP